MSASRDEGMFMSALAAAQVDEPLPRVTWVLYLLLAAVLVAIVWSALAEVEQVSRNDGRIVPDAREQVIASAEVGILRELLVREGDRVSRGQVLVRLDPTRVEAQQNEGQVKRLALQATIARLAAEAAGRPLQFPAELRDHKALMEAETESFEARQRLLEEAVASIGRSAALLGREMRIAQSMAAKGLMSDVEVMRLSRQVNELQLQRSERVSRFRQEASAELVKLRNELAQQQEQMVVRQDALTRTVLSSPVDGLVKNIRANTLGGVITTGAPIMEIVPLTERILVETRIKPAEIGYLRVGQKATIKVAGFDYNVFGGLQGKVEYISPDALGDADKGGDGRYYRALVRTERSTLRYKGEAVEVIPGMNASVEIKTGERSVLSFLLRPMLKTQEAMRER
ncbi:HlyD family type I secretion periplasmic adaptor subunit [Paucibacter sp. PLA-PC-4]|uniref:HlyD family type I secretion periplasmic adaptor subunit n=1 Tax=Paucibacter sp. PLA-PC-4 TaxID=2993655 RepID=UPI00224B66FD|nr:HlyD family type I secretion periplasmic adaptor subunit [Paucibacter sp. PLA-PC-4]MCX2864965.1 HlyD family type I secretion periplasmic adaptor subunit [Paucibacter sp. PLA-PC-4]